MGLPRAGATWVAEVLGRAENTAVVNEPDNETFRPFAVRAKLPLGRFPVLDASDDAPDDYTALWSAAFSSSGGALRGVRALAAATLLQRVDATERWTAFCNPVAPRASLRLRVIRRLAVPAMPTPGLSGQRVVKSAHGALAVEWIAARFDPDVVIVVRHPYNVIASWTELGWGGCGLDSNPKVVERFVRRWDLPPLSPSSSRLARVSWEVGLMLSVLHHAAERHENWQFVSHEQLCGDPCGRFRKLYSALGLTWTPAAEQHLNESNRAGSGLTTRRVARDQPERWRTRLSSNQVREIADVLRRFPVGIDFG